ncbi:MAG TPA: tRNA lysidine(34) synthetase TilS [Casimicrobiaceae bacterium]|nr:tRNA lysidine(34) synthetase TilS [Casimicrobiaceae bacterium]
MPSSIREALLRQVPVEPRDAPPIVAVDSALAAALAAYSTPGQRAMVALSGGMDSIVLLDALHALAPRFALGLSALHVNHQLSSNAVRWAEFCAAACAARGVPLTMARVDVARRPGQSLEAAARAARYRKLLAADADIVVLAHHADDQAETVLLQLLRGAGPAGVAAMPRHRAGDTGGPALLRPLLELPRAVLAAYANARGLAWIDDESNADRRHKRNLLRLDVAPLLREAFPGYPSVLVRAAGHQAEASALLDDLARQDAGDAQDGLERAALVALSPARARNLLRWFLRREGLRPPSTARLAGMLAQLQSAGADARTRIVHDGAEIGCHRGRVVVHAAGAGPYARGWRGESSVELPGGTLRFERTHGAGIAASKFDEAVVTLCSRRGGERLQLAANRPRRAVKKLLYDAQLPIWRREALPFIWCGEELAAVPGIGVALAFQARPGEAGWSVDWHPR